MSRGRRGGGRAGGPATSPATATRGRAAPERRLCPFPAKASPSGRPQLRAAGTSAARAAAGKGTAAGRAGRTRTTCRLTTPARRAQRGRREKRLLPAAAAPRYPPSLPELHLPLAGGGERPAASAVPQLPLSVTAVPPPAPQPAPRAGTPNPPPASVASFP